jgi:hypothetical protein
MDTKKAGMLAKTVKFATAWREANSSRGISPSQGQQQKGGPPQQGCQK